MATEDPAVKGDCPRCGEADLSNPTMTSCWWCSGFELCIGCPRCGFRVSPVCLSRKGTVGPAIESDAFIDPMGW
jgi:hypothetical protein